MSVVATTPAGPGFAVYHQAVGTDPVANTTEATANPPAAESHQHHMINRAMRRGVCNAGCVIAITAGSSTVTSAMTPATWDMTPSS